MKDILYRKEIKMKSVLTAIMIMIIFITLMLVKGIFAYFTDFTGQISNIFTVLDIQLTPVAKIIEVPEGYEETLLNQEYRYLNDAFNALPQNTTGFTIQIIDQINNQVAVFENRNVKLDLNGYTVRSLNSTTAGITVRSGNLTIIDSSTNGIIINESGVGINIEENGTLTLGVKEATSEEPELKPVIEGATKGIVNEGTFNYYDGIIRGKTASLDGQATDTPMIYSPNTSKMQDDSDRYETVLAIPSGAVAFIGRTPYTTLQNAINAANNAENGGKGTSEDEIEIDLIKDIGTDSNDDSYNMIYTVDNTKYIKLDLNGHTITTGVRNNVIQNEGKLEIIDSTKQDAYEIINDNNETEIVPAVEGTGQIFSTTSDTILNKSSGQLVISGGTISSQGSYCKAINNMGTSKLTVQGGIINNSYYAIAGEGTSEITVLNGANISSSNIGIKCSAGSKLTVNGGSIYCNSYSSRAYCISTEGYGNILIAGGTISTNGANCLYATNQSNNTGNIIINGGTFESPSTGNPIIECNPSYGNLVLTINNCNITSKSTVVSTNYKTITNINGGTFNINSGKLFSNTGTMNIINGTFTFNNTNLGTNNGTLNISNLTFNVNGGLTNSQSNSYIGTSVLENVTINATGRAVTSYAGTVTLKNTNLTSTSNNAVYIDTNGGVIVEKAEITSSSIAIYSEGALQLGTNDNVIVNDDIIVKSTANEGINSTGTFKYYDGKVKGLNTKGAFIGIVTEIPSGKNILISQESNLQVAQIGIEDGVAQVGDDPSNVFGNLQSAVDACSNGVSTNIKILKDFYITGSEVVTVGAEKRITINLDGHTISEIGSGETIINNGTVTLTDNNGTKGKIQTYGTCVINNIGTMVLENNITYQMLLSDNRTVLKNSGNLIISNANIIGNSLTGVSAIENNGEGNITIDNATINITNSYNGSTYGIINNSTNEIIINNINIVYVTYETITNKQSGTVTINGGTYSNYRGDNIVNKSSGTIIINGGTINKDVTNESTGTITITEGKISGTVKNSEASGYVNISGTVEDTQITGGIVNQANATLEITGGYITASKAIENSGTLTIGTKNTVSEQDPDIRNPYIKGTTYGLYINSGTVNFYDGKIEGSTNNAIYGTVTNIEDGFQILTYKAGDTFNGGTVANNRQIKVLGLEDVAEVTSTGLKYGSLRKAVEAASSSQQDTITIIKGITMLSSASSVEIPANKNIIIDLKGYTITASNENTIINKGTLQITDTANDTKGKITNSESTAIKNNSGATLLLGTITVEDTAVGEESQSIDIIKNEGTLNITGATITANNNYITAIHNSGSGSITIVEGNITLNAGQYSKNVCSILNDGTGNINLNANQLSDITITARTPINNQSSGNITINNGQINGYDYSINNDGIGNITINDGSFNKNINNNSSGDITINNGSMEDLKNNGSGTVTIENVSWVGTITNSDGGIIDFRGGSAQSIETSYSSTGTILVSGGTISGKSRGVYLKGSSQLEVTGGTISGSNYAILIESANASAQITGGTITNSSDIAISNSGTLILGTNLGELNQISPSISGNTYGVENSGTFKFYGGIIEASTNESIYGVINEIKSNTTLDISIINAKEVAKLISVTNVAEVDGTGYSNLQSAVNACQDNVQKTITILNNFSMTTGDEVTIAGTKDIILNLNGKTIMGYTNQCSITNNGSLKLTDTTGGKLEARSCDLITNNASLELEAGTIKQVYGGTNAVYKNSVINKGTTNLSGSTLTSSSKEYITGIVNKESGNLTVNSGQINIITGNGIENTENGIVKVLGGTISAGKYAIYDKSTRPTSQQVITTEVSGGTISTNSKSINLEGNANLKVNGTANISIIYTDSNSSKALVEGGNVNYIGINKGSVTITGGTVENSNGLAIYNNGSLVITGGVVKSTPNNAILNRGTALIKDSSQIISQNETAIYNNGGTLTLGEFSGASNEPAPNQTNPSVSGYIYGVQNTGTFNFYDGVITGETLAISGTITATPTNYIVRYENDNTKATLKLQGIVYTVVTYQGQTYASIEDPIQLICNNNKTGVLIITDDITLQNQIVIPSDVNITFVMQGHTISYNDSQAAIVNNGTITVYDYLDADEPDTIDPNEVSTIINTSGPAIQNNGTLILGKSSEPNNTYSPMIIGVTNAITGNAPIIYDGGQRNN